ncbi:SlyX family protein [Furfurilactobacillus rossiae]|uniref:Uncharacterized protein n=1 Tax=Furfurilactobacillus rossiae DSM 15814 TaxID=1114972 RepID=A0A0R1RU01_9LACO|nr:SlyX family protein [Furfurilactobacillus rossiae]KRL56691.1 hypothetical protein FD35_GL001791 [Furfurilactobacillus rossiae DSM 15814]QLE61863.1 hypothetical protein LROSRS0_1818 [Furfurilactobacillus rossiae]
MNQAIIMAVSTFIGGLLTYLGIRYKANSSTMATGIENINELLGQIRKQSQTIEDLNNQVFEQSKVIDTLTRKVGELEQKLTDKGDIKS